MRSIKFSIAAFSFTVLALLNANGARNSCCAQEQTTPSNVYLDYHQKLMSAGDVGAIEPMMAKDVADKIKATPASMKGTYLTLLRSLSPKNVKVVNEQVDGEKALLTLKGDSKQKANGQVTLVRELDGWKVDQESWQAVQR